MPANCLAPHLRCRRRLAKLCVLLMVGGACLPACAQIYKWVDKDGVTHYDQSAPPDKKSTVVDVRPAASAPSNAPATDWSAQDRAFRERQIAREDAERKAKAQKDKLDAQRRQTCDNARNRLEHAEAGSRMYQLDENGNRVYLTDDQRADAIRAAQQQVADNC